MKLSTLILIALWPTTLFLVVRAIATCLAAWRYATSKDLQQLNNLQAFIKGTITVYPWKSRIAYAVVSLLLLAYFQGWLELS